MPVLDPKWFSDCKMERIIVHWTAGTYAISTNDKRHYHFLVDKDGKGWKGLNPVSGNARYAKLGAVTSHTLRCNTGSIGIAVASMGDAEELPFKPGPWPLTELQWTGLMGALAELCVAYAIPCAPKTLLMHGEVQKNLNIPQRGKWDIGRLPFKLELKGCRETGPYMRKTVAALLRANGPPVGGSNGIS